RGLARHLRQAVGIQRGERHRNAAGGVERIDQRVGNVVLVAVEGAGRRRREIQDQVEVGVGGIVAQRIVEVRRQIGVDQRAEAAAYAAGGQDGVLFLDIAAGREAG